ncbi:hypothetical protein D3C81_968570 [compost metagenome]
MLRFGLALRRVGLRRLADLGDAIDGIAIGAQVNANHRGQLGGIGAHHRLDRLRRHALGLGARHGLHRAEAIGAVGLLQRLETRLAILAGQLRCLLGDIALAHLGFHFLELAHGGRAIVDDAGRDQRIRRDLDGFGIALLLDRVFAEQCLQHLLVVERVLLAQGRVRLTGHVVGDLDRQLELVGGRLQAVSLFVHRVAEGVGLLGELLVGQLLAQLGFQFGAHGFKRPGFRRLDAGQLDDVVAIVGLDHVADLAILERVHRVLERLDQRAPAHEAEVAALLGRARILRLLLRHVGKGRGMLAQFFQQPGRLVLGGLAFGSRRILRRGDQDMAGAALLVGTEARDIAFVVGLQLFRRDRLRGGKRFARQHQVFDLGLLRHRECRLVAVIVSLQRGGIGLYLGGVAGRLEHQRLHIALLVTHGDQALEQRLGHECRGGHRCAQLLRRQLEAHAGIELLGRHALRLQQLQVRLVVDLAVFRARQLGDRRQAADFLEQLGIRHGQVLARHGIGHHALQDQLVKYRLAGIRALELARIIVVAEDLARTLALVTHDVIDFLHADGPAIDLGRIVRAVHEARVALHAEEHERRENKHQQQQEHQAPVVAYEIKHADSGSGLARKTNSAILAGAGGDEPFVQGAGHGVQMKNAR